jgi:hypothetical protein
VISSKYLPVNLCAIALLAYSASAKSDISIPPIPTNGPAIPTTIPPIPTTGPAVPTSIPSIPTSGPSIPVVTPTYVYTFSGFRAPIVNNGITNTTKGKSVRFGWNLTDKSGTNIMNPAVVVDRFYKEIDCNTDVASSGINPAGIKLNMTTWNKGRKDLEFSWTVPNLRKSCLLFTVVFDDAQTASAKFYVK